MTQPHLTLIATGGTIAATGASPAHTHSYVLGTRSAEALVGSLPQSPAALPITLVQPFNLGSEHLCSAHWLTLARTVRAAQEQPGCRGIVLTHGTDTLEETALFLDLVCPRTHPIVLTGAMRPASALSADGPRNLYAAIQVAQDPRHQAAGVMVVMNDEIFAPDRVAKQHTSSVAAFAARDAAPLGWMVDNQPVWKTLPSEAAARRPSLAAQWPQLLEQLPRVDLIQTHVDADPRLVAWLQAQGARALVVAGTGHGSLAEPMRMALIEARRQGCWIVRASRLAAGPVMPGAGGIADAADGFVAARFVSAHKARLVTALALACDLEMPDLDALFQVL